ncbi:MAG: hypothetical protein AVDCRST_MAG54-129 [uncultured Actinomycetospora sp.]|uniref:Uncharacterized protein n=1 Tax=uncultured Actinomycetospora sp. TaxID=1135996 RepID=A0A6J4H1M2_9PSEU|nr:MAG: hypothetical protein AVDCRST_MAG54-129 [uncultured Actinomycetospora sp.]
MNQILDYCSLPSRVQPAEGSLALFDRHLSVVLGGMERRFHYVWACQMACVQDRL